jgi:nonsense-mediated mRNA decay protein 3
VEYIVMQVEPIADRDRQHRPGMAAESQRHQLADVWVVRATDLGKNDEQLHCRSHLGHLLNPADTVLGFDVRNANVNEPNFEKMKTERIPDVVLVKKVYADSNKRARKRKWTLKRLDGDTAAEDGESVIRDYNDFLEDLEEDPAYRQNVNIYKGTGGACMPVDTDETDDEDFPRVSLAEMLDDLSTSVDATGGEGAEKNESRGGAGLFADIVWKCNVGELQTL